MKKEFSPSEVESASEGAPDDFVEDSKDVVKTNNTKAKG